MPTKFILLLFAFIIPNNISSQKILKIPFKFYSTSQLFPNQSDPVTNIYMSQILIEISIGNPPQKLNCSLNLISFYSLFLSHKIPDIEFPSYYNKNISSTYNQTKEMTYYWEEDFNYAETFTDKIQLFSLDNKKILDDSFTFLLIDGLGYGIPNEFYAPGLIGLRLRREEKKQQIDENRFIYQIKKLGLTDTEIFCFDFNKDDNNGNFVIGEDLFNNENYLKINVGSLYFPTLGLEWSFNFNRIYSGNTEIKETLDALIKTENGLTIGPKTYETIIDEFFKSESKCKYIYKKMGYGTFKYYYCEEDFDENLIEDLVFELKLINFNFTFSGKELFYTENNIKYFKILFLYSYNQPYWYFGRDFLKKYKLRFDTERKLIYIPLKEEDKDANSVPTTNQFHIWIYIVIILGIIILGLIIFIVVYLKKYPRKKRANELEEDFDYTQKDKLNENIN